MGVGEGVGVIGGQQGGMILMAWCDSPSAS